MRIAIAYDKGCLRRWHVWLADALRENHDVVLRGIDRATPYPAGITLLQSLERTLYRRSGESASEICKMTASPVRRSTKTSPPVNTIWSSISPPACRRRRRDCASSLHFITGSLTKSRQRMRYSIGFGRSRHI